MTVQNGTVLYKPTTQITLQFDRDGTFLGNGGCNNDYGTSAFARKVTPFGSGMALSPITSIKAYCRERSSPENY
ncbi:MAG: META domain-containing protein [Methanoregula sp.]|nr:META domain-containing protein [Methanoregula sp.]